MLQFIKKSLTWRLAILLFTGALFSIVMVAVPVFHYSGKSLKQAAFKRLSAVNEIKKNQILRYLEEKTGDLKILSKSQDVKKAFELFQSYHLESKKSAAGGHFNTISTEYTAINQKIDPFFRQYGEVYGYDNIFLICRYHGHVMYTLTQTPDRGTNLDVGPYKESGLASIWKKILEKKKTVMADFSIYAPTGKPSLFLGAPIIDQNEINMIGVLCLQISTEKINVIMHETTGMGETEETCIIGKRDSLMRSDSRFEGFKGNTILKKKIKTDAMFSRYSDIETAKNYMGLKVLRSYNYLELEKKLETDFDWIIISEIGEKEAFASVRKLGFIILAVGVSLLFLSCIMGYFLAKQITMPLKKLSDKVVAMADGDLTVTISHGKRTDEVGSLINAFYYTLSSFRNQIHQIMEGTSTISSSISQISATSSQLAASSSESSSSVTQITTTVEEVRQTAQISNEKAEYVAQSAEKAADISETGKKATEDAIFGMNRIKEEMEYVAESIIKLSTQTQSIGEIISAVNDLADQSNLLSVNASIEAAKAGDHGRGFAVVAQEVKSLADQSKEATNQVRTILNDIQRATGAAVMATERGTKAVEAGVELSVQSGDSIAKLSESVTEASQAAIQIAASSQEQLIGMDQLARAMQSIKDASLQNVDSARQLENAAKKLEDLGKELKQLALMYKL